MSKFFKGLVLAASLTVSATSFASTLDFLGTGNVTSGWGRTVQTFNTGGVNNTLLSYSFGTPSSSPQTNFVFNIYDWSTPGEHAPLYTFSGAWQNDLVTISNINLSLLAGHQYAAEVDYLGTTSGGVLFTGNVYSGGSGFWSSTAATNGDQSNYSSYPDLDTRFRAEFGSTSAVPLPAAAWLFGTGLVGLAGLRRKVAA